MKLKEVIDYFPNCILCGKQLNLYISGYETRRIYLIQDNNFLKNSKLDIKIDIETNQIISGCQILNNNYNQHFLKKSCTTCRCTVRFLTEKNITSYFPDATLHAEEVHFFDNGCDITITNHKNTSTIYWRKTKKSQKLPQSFNFLKINNLAALKKKIHTIQLFQ